MLLLIAGQPRTARLPKRLQQRGDLKAPLWQLAQPQWLLDRSAAKADADLNWSEGRLGILVRLAPGQQYSGALTSWSDEEALLWHYFRRPLDAHSFRIERAVALDNPAVLTKGEQKDLGSGTFHRLPFAWDASHLPGRTAGVGSDQGARWLAEENHLTQHPSSCAVKSKNMCQGMAQQTNGTRHACARAHAPSAVWPLCLKAHAAGLALGKLVWGSSSSLRSVCAGLALAGVLWTIGFLIW